MLIVTVVLLFVLAFVGGRAFFVGGGGMLGLPFGVDQSIQRRGQSSCAFMSSLSLWGFPLAARGRLFRHDVIAYR